LIGDRAYDSDPLDVQIRQGFGVQLVAPITAGAAEKPRKMAGCCAAIVGVGKSSACSPGFIIFVAW
jgi:hypothetical protein